MIRLIHLADLHLGWQSRSMDPVAGQALAAERDRVLEQAVDYALARSNGISGMIIAGDLFDAHRPPAALAERVIGLLSRLAAAGVAVITVPGNHDELTYSDSVYRQYGLRWPGILVTSPEPCRIATVSVGSSSVYFYGVAYVGGVTRPGAPLAGWPSPDGPGVHVAVAHGTIVGAAGLPAEWVSDDRSLPLAAESLGTRGYHYVALGHIHRPGLPAGWPAHWSPCRYAGLAAGRGFDDQGCGSLLLVDIDEAAGGLVTVSERCLDVPKYLEVRVDAGALGEQGSLVDDLQAQLADVPAGALVRIRLTGVAPQAPDTTAVAAGLLAGGKLRHVEVVDDTIVLSQLELAQWSAEPTVRGFFVRRLAARLNAARECGDTREQQLVERALRHGIQALIGGPDR